ncbi:MAG: hypothetical protein QNJ41_27305 [Xenococcaceae cyanobacterium MO_188.B32]|nr:hypothetical protein [Xenococcaceae cyanobacterium MO_188.B32]
MINNIKYKVGAKANQQLDRLLSEVFKYCLNERQITCLLVNQDNQLIRVFYSYYRRTGDY